MKSIFIFFFLMAGLFNWDSPSMDGSKDRESVKIAGIVLKWIPRERERNFVRFEKLVREAARKQAKIVCSTECFLDGYSARDRSITPREFCTLTVKKPDGKIKSRNLFGNRLDDNKMASLDGMVGICQLILPHNQ